jgi:hypothetical protein
MVGFKMLSEEEKSARLKRLELSNAIIQNAVVCKSYFWYEDNRPEHVAQVEAYKNERKVIIDAEPKVGKRLLKIIETIGSKISSDKDFHHVMFTSLDRKDNKEQWEEMETYGIKCLHAKELKDVLEHIEKLYESHSGLYIFIDESDYGTDTRQKMNELFEKLCINVDRLEKSSNFKKPIYLRYFSATNEEIRHSEYGKDCYYHKFESPSFYRGSKWYLANDLVHKAERFFIFNENGLISPSNQALELLHEFADSDQNKPFAILRVANKDKNAPNYKNVKADNALKEWLWKEYKIYFVCVDQNDSMNWGMTNRSNKSWSTSIPKEAKVIFLINQTCTRSTEVSFLPLIYFWHDYRSPKTPYNTIIQAEGRVFHYPYVKNEDFWNTDNPDSSVHLYADVDCVRYCAGEITQEELDRSLSGRVVKKGGGKNFVATSKMIAARKLEIVTIPENVLKKSAAKNNKNKNKQRFPVINNWLRSQTAHKKHLEQYQTVTKDKTLFLRTVSGNNKADIADSLVRKEHHGILAPVFTDDANPLYLKSWNKLIEMYGEDIKNKIILLKISDEELQARKDWQEGKRNVTFETKNSMFNSNSIKKL